MMRPSRTAAGAFARGAVTDEAPRAQRREPATQYGCKDPLPLPSPDSNAGSAAPIVSNGNSQLRDDRVEARRIERRDPRRGWNPR